MKRTLYGIPVELDPGFTDTAVEFLPNEIRMSPWHWESIERRWAFSEQDPAPRSCVCVCHQVGLLGFMCCPCTTKIFRAVADEGGNNVSVRSPVTAVPQKAGS